MYYIARSAVVFRSRPGGCWARTSRWRRMRTLTRLPPNQKKKRREGKEKEAKASFWWKSRLKRRMSRLNTLGIGLCLDRRTLHRVRTARSRALFFQLVSLTEKKRLRQGNRSFPLSLSQQNSFFFLSFCSLLFLSFLSLSLLLVYMCALYTPLRKWKKISRRAIFAGSVGPSLSLSLFT